jgi:ribosomal protein S18 acetylase RimI-like enzyme
MYIDEVKPSEIGEIKKILSEVWIDTYGKLFSEKSIEKITSNWHSKKLLFSQATDKDCYFSAAKINKKIVGLITVKKFPDNSLFLYRLYVSQKYQGMHVGSKLLESAIKYFPMAKKIKLECEQQNEKACLFYLHKGFKKIAEKEEVIEGVKMQTIEFEKAI